MLRNEELTIPMATQPQQQKIIIKGIIGSARDLPKTVTFTFRENNFRIAIALPRLSFSEYIMARSFLSFLIPHLTPAVYIPLTLCNPPLI